MNKPKKMTKREQFEALKAKYALTADEIAFIDHEIDLLSKKTASERKPTARQSENATYKADILAAMEQNVLYSVTDVWKGTPSLAANGEMTNQRVTAILSQMVAEGTVKRIEDKRKAYFQLS
jgi:hypothetical protein